MANMLQPHTIFSNFLPEEIQQIMCQVVAYGRWKTKFKTVILKKVVIVAYKINDLKIFGILEKCLLMRGGCKGGSTLALP